MMKNVVLILVCILAVNFLSAQNGGNKPVPDNDPKVFQFVEEMPVYPGGEFALKKYLRKNLHYPKKEKKQKIEGKVIVRFVINEDGSITNETVVKSVSEGLDAEAVRLIKSLHNFAPGRQQGKAVKVYYVIPVVFEL